MPAVDTTYIIGVIREWEKGFLQNDEYTRLITAATDTEAIRVLIDTPYGQWIDEKKGLAGVFHALDKHLNSIRLWLADKVMRDNLIPFICARYDALNIATCLLQKKNGQVKPGPLSQLGCLDRGLLHTAIWNDVGWDKVPTYWEIALREILARNPDTTTLLNTIADQAVTWLNTLAFSPLSHAIAAHEQNKLRAEHTVRPFRSEQAAFAFEDKWDEQLMTLLRPFRHHPISYDPILAFWYAKELERKNIRVVLTAKLVGLPRSAVQDRQRSLYRSYA